MGYFALSLLVCQLAVSYAAESTTIPLYLENSQLDPIADRSSRNVAYYGQFTLGSSSFTGCFDTGSSDLWVPSANCKSEACQKKRQFQGTGNQISSQTFEIQYGTGAVAGYDAEDTFGIGSPAINLTSQVFGDAVEVSTDFISTSCDGLFGLAFPGISSIGAYNPFFNMVAQNLLTAPMFSLYLNPNSSAVNAGQLILGGSDSSLYTGNLNAYAVLDPSYWVIALAGASVNSQAVQLEANASIIDSGTTGIVMSDADAGNISALIPRLTYWADMDVYNVTGSCSDLSDLPNITFTIGTEQYSLPPSAWVTEISDDIDTTPDVCISSIQPGGSTDAVVLGTSFLRTFYSSFTLNITDGGITGASVSLAPGITGPPTGTTQIYGPTSSEAAAPVAAGS